MTKDHLAELERLLPGRVLLEQGPREECATDSTGIACLPDAVVEPETTADVAEVVRLANQRRFPLTGRGAGTGTTGGAIPAGEGVVISFRRMNRLLELDARNGFARIQPGLTTLHLKKAAEAEGLFYPPDPASMETCTLGGNLAECAAGPCHIKYGSTRNWVLGLETVLGSGEIVRTGSRTHKCVTGYDLTRLLVGSEGTLALITEATLRLIPKPESVGTLLAFFPNTDFAAKASMAILEHGVLPSALEFLDASALECARSAGTYPFPEAVQAVLFVEVDGCKTGVAQEASTVRMVLASSGAFEVRVASNHEEAEAIWAARRAISPAQKALAPGKVNEDVVLPRTAIPEAIRRIQDLAARHGLRVVIFGHIGDGNLHVNFLHHRTPEEIAHLEEAVDELFTLVLEYGGTLSGEHGIGVTKAPYLEREIGAESLALHRRIKAVFDPNGILNPGKLFPASHDRFFLGEMKA